MQPRIDSHRGYATRNHVIWKTTSEVFNATVATDEFADGINVRDLVNIDSIHCPSGKMGDWSRSLYKSCHSTWNLHTGWWFWTCFIVPYIANNHPTWLSYVSRWLKPPTRYLIGCWLLIPWACHRLDGRLRNSGWRVQVCCHMKQTIEHHTKSCNNL